MPVNEFIRALIRHIPDHQFKTIRRYGIYGRRTKSLMRKVLEAYQTIVHKMLVNVKEALKPKSWAERITEEFGTNPMECTECGEYYEFYGLSAAQNGRLVVKYAKNEEARCFMREENKKLEKKRPNVSMRKKKGELLRNFDSSGAINYICFDWGINERIQKEVVQL